MSEHTAGSADVATRPERRPTPRRDPAGIGGWLILPAMGLVVAPIQSMAALALLASSIRAAAPEQVTLADWGAGALYFALLVIEVCVAWLFFRRKRSAPRAVIAYYALSLVILPTAMLAGFVRPDVETVEPFKLGVGVVMGVVWIAYFLTSTRVRNTFTR